MVNVFDIATRCDTPLQLVGLFIITMFFISIAFIAYMTICFIGKVILHFSKVDVTVDKVDVHINTHLSQ